MNAVETIVTDNDGTIRIKGSRVSLDSIVHQFKLGATAEQIQEDFPSLSLREVYGAIYFYLDNEEEIEKYLERQEEKEDATKQFIDTHFDSSVLRERIRARRQQMTHK